MTTLDRPVGAISGAIVRTLPRRRILAIVLRCTPRFRILRASLRAVRLYPLKHNALSELMRRQWHRTRLRSSWSRA